MRLLLGLSTLSAVRGFESLHLPFQAFSEPTLSAIPFLTPAFAHACGASLTSGGVSFHDM